VRALWLGGGAVLCGAATAVAQPSASHGMMPIEPTVTAAMGDVGGRFFGRPPDPGKTRHYYIAAESELWDYAPRGMQMMCSRALPPPVAAQPRASKIRHVQYTDDSFEARVMQNPRLGILGPVLRGVVGEYFAVTFLNRTEWPLSMHPHGLKYDKDSEGAHYQPGPGLGAAVGPNARFTYVWHLDESSGPLPDEPSSKGWLYHSHVKGDEEVNLGLIGFIIVTDPKRARPDGTPVDVDREQASLFMIFDESGLGEAEKEAAEYAALPDGGPPPMSWSEVQELTERGSRYSINGYVFGNLPGLEMNEGERVRWYLFALGSERDFHTAHWHGLRVVDEGRRRTDVVELLPATMKVADAVADNPGTWLLHCHVAEHMMEGMFAPFIVHASNTDGVSRAAGQAFLGLPEARQSLQIRNAEAVCGPVPDGADPSELKLDGAVTVFEAFSVHKQVIGLRIGDLSIEFGLDRQGVARTSSGSFQVKNASPYGVVYGGIMEFEATLTGGALLSELKRLGLDGKSAKTIPLDLALQIGKARHNAIARIACGVKP
jgi:FtsP/CotA-like multicopper oxidase with cupredoxin domain